MKQSSALLQPRTAPTKRLYLRKSPQRRNNHSLERGFYIAEFARGDDPVNYTDLWGLSASDKSIGDSIKYGLTAWVEPTKGALVNSFNTTKNAFENAWNVTKDALNPFDDKAPGVGAIPEEDRWAIAQHAYDQGHGEVDFPGANVADIKGIIDNVLADPDTQVGTRNRGGEISTGYFAPSPNDILVIHNPSKTNPDEKGTVFEDKNGDTFYSQFR